MCSRKKKCMVLEKKNCTKITFFTLYFFPDFLEDPSYFQRNGLIQPTTLMSIYLESIG